MGASLAWPEMAKAPDAVAPGAWGASVSTIPSRSVEPDWLEQSVKMPKCYYTI